MPDMDTVVSRIETICEICKTNKWKTEFDSDTIYPLLTDALAMLKEQEKQKFFVDENGKITPLPVVVRCKDCKKRETMYCPFYWRYKGTKYDDWFCADGERTEGR